MKFNTKQEKFWAENFGNEYFERNKIQDIVPSKVNLFSEILKNTGSVNSFLEFGPNIGINLIAIKKLMPKAELNGVEINSIAKKKLEELKICKSLWQDSILNFSKKNLVDFSFTSGVLIHINPEYLSKAYEALYHSSKKYILICEYYNPTPVSIDYRGFKNRLFKRDFAGDLLEKYPDLNLINYGFKYKNDNNHPLDDVTWFLLRK